MATKKAKKSKSAAPRKAARKSPRKQASKRWSARVTRTSNALDLEKNVFKSTDPKRVAQSLKRSATTSRRKKGTARQSAMSMLNFYLNRAGKNLPAKNRKALEKAKNELRKLFDKQEKRQA